MSSKVIIFDLDDTLYKEIDFLKSAFLSIAKSFLTPHEADKAYLEMIEWYYNRENVFANLIKSYKLDTDIPFLIKNYRSHYPDINLDDEIKELLYTLRDDGHKIGLITDGFSMTQRNKIKALGLESFFDSVVISEEFGSEKPNPNNFRHFLQFHATDYFYIADNLKKDFIVPNQLAWNSICLLDNGQNIHKQDFNQDEAYLPKHTISSIKEVLFLINS